MILRAVSFQFLSFASLESVGGFTHGNAMGCRCRNSDQINTELGVNSAPRQRLWTRAICFNP